jgi:NADPH:quinone reductase-like Zn-dependent oxidoreductase
VGAATWADDVRSMARGGRLLICGAHTGVEASVNLWHLFAKELTIAGSYGGSRGDLHSALELVKSGTVTPVVHASLPLERAAEGLALLQRREHFGKVLLEVGEGE